MKYFEKKESSSNIKVLKNKEYYTIYGGTNCECIIKGKTEPLDPTSKKEDCETECCIKRQGLWVIFEGKRSKCDLIGGSQNLRDYAKDITGNNSPVNSCGNSPVNSNPGSPTE